MLCHIASSPGFSMLHAEKHWKTGSGLGMRLMSHRFGDFMAISFSLWNPTFYIDSQKSFFLEVSHQNSCTHDTHIPTWGTQYKAPLPDGTGCCHSNQRLPSPTGKHNDPWSRTTITKHLTKTLLLIIRSRIVIVMVSKMKSAHNIVNKPHPHVCARPRTWYGLSRVVGLRSIL